MSEAMLQDLGTYAEQHGETLDAVIERFNGQMEFGSLVNDLEADPKSGYVEAAWRRPATADPWIRFTDKPGPAMLSRIENETPVRTQVQWGAPLKAKALVRLSEAIFGAVADFPGVAETVGGPNPDGSIEIEYRIRKNATVDVAELRKSALRAGAKVSPSGDVPVEVRLTESPGLRSRLK